MIFSELYSNYYQTVAKILKQAQKEPLDAKQLRRIISENAFEESGMTIEPAIMDGKWQVLDSKGTPVIQHEPTFPVTLLEKRWLKAILLDPRVRLFDIRIDGLDEIEPLFTPEDYKIFDEYLDGDPYEDEQYIANFRLIVDAIRSGQAVGANIRNQNGGKKYTRFIPVGLEYSEKDDKFRVMTDGFGYSQINLARIENCWIYEGDGPWNYHPIDKKVCALTLEVIDERNALERSMLHFAHYEKQVERIDEDRYLLHLKYQQNDETELVIRVLSFGPCVKVVEPNEFVNLIRKRLMRQKSCELE